MSMTEAQYAALLNRGTQPEAEGTHAQRNRTNQREGASFENRLIAYHQALAMEGLARVIKINQKIRIISASTAQITGRGEADFCGIMLGGRGIAFDAKSRAGASFSIDKDFAHQVKYLEGFAGLGGVAGLLVWWKDANQCRWHPIGSFEKTVKAASGLPIPDVNWYGFV